KVRRGEWPGPAPLGYVNDRNVRKLVADPIKGPLIRRLFERYAAGHVTLKQLRQESFGWGLVTKNDRQLSVSEVQRVLTNPLYYGVFRYVGEVHQGIHPALITKELFDQVQSVLKDRGRPHIQRRHLFPLLGLAHCKHCG